MELLRSEKLKVRILTEKSQSFTDTRRIYTRTWKCACVLQLYSAFRVLQS